VLVAALAAAVVPFAVLTHYANPSADDFCYAPAFAGDTLWESIIGEYLRWKGRYTSIALNAAYHHTGGMLVTYPYAMLAYLAAFAVAVFVWVNTLAAGTGPLRRRLFLTLGLVALYLATMPYPAATLYWIDGAFQYQTGLILTLLTLSAVTRLYRSGTTAAAALTCVLVFLAVGAGIIAMLVVGAVAGLLALDQAFIKGRARLSWALVVLVTAVSALLLLAAPGNYVRAQLALPEANQFWFSVRHASYHSGATLVDWLGQPALWLATAAFVPVSLRLVYLERLRAGATPFRLLLVAVLMPVLLWLGFFAMWWAVARNPPGRMLNMMYFLFLAGWFTLILELVAVVARQCSLVLTEALLPARLRLGSAAASVLLAASLLLQGNVRPAWGDLILGRAADYDRQMEARYARVAIEQRQAGEEELAMTFRGITNPPAIVMYTDIQNHPGNFRNNCFARYFGLESVVRE